MQARGIEYFYDRYNLSDAKQLHIGVAKGETNKPDQIAIAELGTLQSHWQLPIVQK